MSLRISGKHMDVGESLSARIEDRVAGAVGKYFGDGYSGHVTLEKSSEKSGVKSATRFQADCILHLDSGATLQATADAMDASSAFEAAAERLEKRLRRYKRRLKDHHANAPTPEPVDAAYTVVEAPAEEEEVPEDFNPVVVAESSTKVKTLTVAMAVMELDMTDSPVVVFKNAGSNQINVVFRRKDGHIGWIDPAGQMAGTSG